MNTESFFDVLIIGGGASGMMAALSVKKHHPDYTVSILDRTFELGRKMTISGAGRANVTNSNLAKDPQQFFHGDHTLLTSVFHQFGYKNIIGFFEELGIPLIEEKKTGSGKLFPVMEHAKTVRNIYIDRLKEARVGMQTDTSVSELKQEGDRWIVTSNNGIYSSRYVILATGGKTYPALGSDGSGYDLAVSLGHRIIPPVPSAVPLVSKNLLSHLLQGEKMIMSVTSIIDGKEQKTAIGEVLLTQYGFSGPLILDVSRDISIRINREGKTDTTLQCSFFPQSSRADVEQMIRNRLKKHPTLPVSHGLWGLLTEKVAGAVCQIAGIPKEKCVQDVSEQEIINLIDVLTAYTTEVTQTRGWNEAEFTAGGIAGEEIVPETLESKKAKGLYVAGELVDVDGPVGGYNLSWAWASGWVAGKLQ